MTQPLTDAINALTRYANETTGQSDTTLSDAVRTLCDGYGGGGWSAEEIEAGAPDGNVVSTSSDVRGYSYANSNIESYVNNTITALYSNQLARNAFDSCKRLTYVEMRNVHRAGSYVFSGCSALTKLILPQLTDAPAYGFQFCSVLKILSLPRLTSPVNYLAQQCSKLEVADLGSCTAIQTLCFNGCSLLRTLVLRRTSEICTANWNNHLGGIYANPTESKVYVPSALISTYQTASGWSQAYNAGVTFEAIEGSKYEDLDWQENE